MVRHGIGVACLHDENRIFEIDFGLQRIGSLIRPLSHLGVNVSGSRVILPKELLRDQEDLRINRTEIVHLFQLLVIASNVKQHLILLRYRVFWLS